jgi:hypothetical protein
MMLPHLRDCNAVARGSTARQLNWRGAFPDGKATDERCFSWIYGGKFVRDEHVVRCAPRDTATSGDAGA